MIIKRSCGLFAALALVSANPSLMHAQEATAADDGDVLEEIIVTARKRTESLQDVPISITAFTSEAIEQRGIESIYDLAKLTPNLSFNQTYGRVFDRPVIRGQSQITGPRTVSFVVDGVYIAGNLSADLDDVEQVEVLKGPQAANYGRSSLAGVISYRTRRPSNEWRGRASVSTGDDGYMEASGVVSGPIVADKLSFKLGGRYYDYDGQYTGASSDGRTVSFGSERTKRVSGALLFEPTENLDFMLRAFVGQNTDSLYNNIIFKTLNCFTTVMGARGGSFCGRIPVIPQDGGIGVDLTDIERQGRPGVEQDTNLYSLESNWRVAPGTVTGLVSWNRQDEDWIVDDYTINNPMGTNASTTPSPTMTVVNPGLITRLVTIREYRSQELRFASDPKRSSLDWMLGVYHYDENVVDATGSPQYNRLTTVMGVPNQPDPANNGPPGTLRRVNVAPTFSSVDNQAVFGSINWDPTDRWHLSLEGRYAKDELATQNTIATGSNCPARLEEEFTSFTPRGSARFDVTEDSNVYVSVSRGNRPGGFNTALCGSDIPPAEFARLSALADLPVEEEKALNYEIGTKLRMLNGRMSLDAAAFFIDWTNQAFNLSELYTTRTGTTANTLLTTNAGKTEVKGLELNWRWRAADWLDLNASYGYTDAEFKKNCDNTFAQIIGATASSPECDSRGTAIFVSVAGFSTANAPKHTGTAGVELNFPLGDRWSFFARTDASYQSERYAEFYNHASTGTSLRFDARLGVSADAWTITAWGRNVGNERSADAVVRFFDPDSPTFNRAYQVHYPNGRQVGLTVAYSFD